MHFKLCVSSICRRQQRRRHDKAENVHTDTQSTLKFVKQFRSHKNNAVLNKHELVYGIKRRKNVIVIVAVAVAL